MRVLTTQKAGIASMHVCCVRLKNLWVNWGAFPKTSPPPSWGLQSCFPQYLPCAKPCARHRTKCEAQSSPPWGKPTSEAIQSNVAMKIFFFFLLPLSNVPLWISSFLNATLHTNNTYIYHALQWGVKIATYLSLSFNYSEIWWFKQLFSYPFMPETFIQHLLCY